MDIINVTKEHFLAHFSNGAFHKRSCRITAAYHSYLHRKEAFHCSPSNYSSGDPRANVTWQSPVQSWMHHPEWWFLQQKDVKCSIIKDHWEDVLSEQMLLQGDRFIMKMCFAEAAFCEKWQVLYKKKRDMDEEQKWSDLCGRLNRHKKLLRWLLPWHHVEHRNLLFVVLCLNGFWSAWTDTPLQLLQRALLFGSFFSTSATKLLVWLCWYSFRWSPIKENTVLE